MAKDMNGKSKRGRHAVPEGEEAGYLQAMNDLLKKSGAKGKSEGPLEGQDQEAAAHYDHSAAASSVRQKLDDSAQPDMVRTVAAYQGMDFVDLAALGLNHDKVRELIRAIGADVVRANRILPLRVLDDGVMEVAISDPLDVTITDSLRMRTDRQIRTVVAEEKDILDFFEMIWGVGDMDLQGVLDAGDKDDSSTLEEVGGYDSMSVDLETDPIKLAAQPPIIRLVNSYLMQTIKDQASDLHIEPFRGMVRVRYRVDGVLRELPDPPKEMQTGLVSRLKVMSNMNIAETRVPQDGRVRLNIDGREVDLRVSSLPTVHGESIVMRILDKSMMMLSINQLGFAPQYLDKFNQVINYPNGIVLVCGPTGCGKTTTLYAALGAINDPGIKIITTEDPVEYQLTGPVQVNINSNIGLTFAACLRSILRQDPDVILVGEIRDVETAEISIQASLTGHLVFSTIHANSAASCATRLVDMGVEPFLITSTIQALVSQRLIRVMCRTCGAPYEPTPEELADFGMTPAMVAAKIQDHKFLLGQGCGDCNHSGFRGRLGIFEFLTLDDELRDHILERRTTDEIHVAAVRKGMQTMRQDGWHKICNGITTFNEVARQTPRESENVIKAEMSQLIGEEEGLPDLPTGTYQPGASAEGTYENDLAAPWEYEAAARAQ